MQPLVVVIVFGVVALAELPDKSLFASLVLSTRYRAGYVFVGVAAAFVVHVAIAVSAGRLLTLLPHRLVAAVVAVLFAGGAVLLWRHGDEPPEPVDARAPAEPAGRADPSFRRVALTSFGVVFIGEWGDITQVVTANYAARYHDLLSVAVGATLGLWAVAGLAVTAGRRLLEYLPAPLVRRVAAAVLIVFAVLSAVQAIR